MSSSHFMLFLCIFIRVSSRNLEGLVECHDVEDCNNYINATCYEGLCRCNEFYTCETKILVNKIGGNCGNDRRCNANNSKCNSENVCACEEGFVPSEDLRRCVKAVAGAFGNKCENDGDCVGEGAHCLDLKCNCKEDYYFSEESKKCRKDKLVGDICEESEECHQPGEEISRMMCIMGECKCKLEYTNENGYCIENNGSSTSTKLQNLKFYLFVIVLIFFL